MNMTRISGWMVGLAMVVIGAAACVPTAAPPSNITTTSTSTTSTSTTTTLPPDVSTLTPNLISVTGDAIPESFDTISVHFAGLHPNTNIYINQCRASSTLTADCSAFYPTVIEFTDNTTGSGTVDFDVFRGAEPQDENWGCYAPTDTPNAGIEFDTTCYIRITDVNLGDVADQQLLPFTFGAS